MKFDEIKKESLTQLAILAEMNIDNTEHGVCDAIAHVFEHGSYRDGAKALMIASHWLWAHHEEAYHAESGK